MPTDHYATLGLDRAASADEIKQAFRRRASAAHPDRGGSADEMAAINAAHEVLSDPERRARYDATGDDTSVDLLDEEARGLLMAALTKALESGEGRFITTANAELQRIRTACSNAAMELDISDSSMRRRRDTLSTTDGATNMAHMLIDAKLAASAATRVQIARQQQILERAQRLLDQHQCSEQAPPVMARADIFGRLAGAIFTDGV